MKVKGDCLAIMLNDHSNPHIESTAVLVIVITCPRGGSTRIDLLGRRNKK